MNSRISTFVLSALRISWRWINKCQNTMSPFLSLLVLVFLHQSFQLSTFLHKTLSHYWFKYSKNYSVENTFILSFNWHLDQICLSQNFNKCIMMVTIHLKGLREGLKLKNWNLKKCPYSYKAIKISRIPQFHFHLKTLWDIYFVAGASASRVINAKVSFTKNIVDHHQTISNIFLQQVRFSIIS